MRKFFGAWLCLALGAVLITTGLTTGTSGSVGTIILTPCAPTDIGEANPCPTAVVTVNETTSVSPAISPAVSPPAGGWTVHVTSPCASTTDGQPVDDTFTVPDGGSMSSQALYAFPNTTDSTKCVYTLAEDAVAGYTTAWDPSNTVTFTVSSGIAENVSVNLTNMSAAPTTAPPSKTPTPSKTPSHTPSKTPTRSHTPSKTPSSAAASSILAQTGPRTRTDLTLWLGIAVFALGLVLLFAGTIGRRRGQHLN